MTRRRRLAHLTAAQLRARSRKGWETRRLAATWTTAQRAHHRAVYNTSLKNRLVREGKCRACSKKREPNRRRFTLCRRCAKVGAARAKRTVRVYRPRTYMRTAA